jgi:hypothetical protein
MRRERRRGDVDIEVSSKPSPISFVPLGHGIGLAGSEPARSGDRAIPGFADTEVGLDLDSQFIVGPVRSLLAIGASPKDIGRAIGRAA